MNTTALSASTAVPDASSPLDVALTHMVKHSFPLRIRVLKIRHLTLYADMPWWSGRTRSTQFLMRVFYLNS